MTVSIIVGDEGGDCEDVGIGWNVERGRVGSSHCDILVSVLYQYVSPLFGSRPEIQGVVVVALLTVSIIVGDEGGDCEDVGIGWNVERGRVGSSHCDILVSVLYQYVSPLFGSRPETQGVVVVVLLLSLLLADFVSVVEDMGSTFMVVCSSNIIGKCVDN